QRENMRRHMQRVCGSRGNRCILSVNGYEKNQNRTTAFGGSSLIEASNLTAHIAAYQLILKTSRDWLSE
ncbi:MAG: hypothetical protein L0Y35_03930, partial [Flammeovirgaceae bacterium]|nr:hypothetical protein [Flammeovirgaceae bacterium]